MNGSAVVHQRRRCPPIDGNTTANTLFFQAGPAVMLFKLGKPWIVGTLVQHWWSYAGDENSPDRTRRDQDCTLRKYTGEIPRGDTLRADLSRDPGHKVDIPLPLRTGHKEPVQLSPFTGSESGLGQFDECRPKQFLDRKFPAAQSLLM